MARNIPLDLYQGDDWNFVVYVHDANGNPVELSGYTAASQLRRSSADTDTTVDATFTCVVGTETVTMYLGHATTLTVTPGSYRWDLQLTDPVGNVITVAYGPATVHADITRAS